MTRLAKIQYNTAGVLDTVLHSNGAETYFETVTPLWEQWLRERHRSVPDMRIVWGKGVEGDEGVEGGWGRLCQGQVGAGEGLVFWM